MAKNALYYREYRARRKAAKLATQGITPLFAMAGSDKEATAKSSEQNKKPRRRAAEKLDGTSMAVEHGARHLQEATMGDLINFKSRAMITAALEEQKEAIICEVLAEVAETLEQQHAEAATAGCATVAVPKSFEQVASEQVAQPVATMFKWLRNHGSEVALATFLVGNTSFLVFQQYSFYAAAGYSALVALATATLMEVALVMQSFLVATHRGILRLALVGTMVATVLTVAQVLHTGIATKTATTMTQGAEAEAIKKRIGVLETLEASAIASIEQLDAKTYPTKIEALRNRLNEPGGYSHQIAELRKELVSVADVGATVAGAQGQALVYQQWLFLLLNIVLAHVLGVKLRSWKLTSR